MILEGDGLCFWGDENQKQILVATESMGGRLIDEEINKGKLLLLIMEDNSDMRLYIQSILENEFNIVKAHNGAVGLELTNRYQPDLIISDIIMSVILLTTKFSTDTQIESFHIDADAFLIKPFNEDLLQTMIRNLNEGRQRVQLRFAESMDTNVLNIGEKSLDKKFIEKSLKVLKGNYTNSDFDVTECIDTMGISRSLLHKKLKNMAGQSASRFIRITD